MIMDLVKSALCACCLLLLTSCEEVFIGGQPRFLEETHFEPALNVFGIVRPDSLYGQPASFVIVGVIAPAINDTHYSWLLDDSYVAISEQGNSHQDTPYLFTYQRDTLRQEKYLNNNFSANNLVTYKLTCYKYGYDTVFGYTALPPKAELETINYNEGQLQLVIKNQNGSFMFEIYASNSLLSHKVVPIPETPKTRVALSLPSKPSYIDIYTYDENLANYYGSTNVFIKLNTFRKAFSSVENGYGCFGSLNHIRFYLD
jgi:hypothetical protein